MKRVIAIILTLVMVMSLFLSASLPASADSGEIDTARKRMLTIWTDYMSRKEIQYTASQWTYTYINAFVESREWADLSAARSVCISATETLKELKDGVGSLPLLSTEEIAVLNSAEIDNSYLNLELKDYPRELDDVCRFFEDGLRVRLERLDRLSESDMRILKDLVAWDKHQTELECEALCNATNYLLLTSQSPDIAREYWDALPENFPVISAHRIDWLDTEETVYAEAAKINDRLDEVAGEDAYLEAEKAAQSFETPEAARAVLIKNLPQLLPCPAWYNPSVTLIYNFYEREDGTFALLDLNGTLPQKPVNVSAFTRNVTEADFDAYLELLRELGFAPYKVNKEWVITLPEYMLILEYNAGELSMQFLKEDITFAPEWFMRAE